MSALLPIAGTTVTALDTGWRMAVAEAGAFGRPADLDGSLAWYEAKVPGTAAEALADAGLFDPARPEPLHGKDIWYRTIIRPERRGPHRLRFEGLATIAEAWLGGSPILASSSMFEASEVDIDLAGEAELTVCFRALQPHLAKRGPRARWRTQLTPEQGLRLTRTTMLGHMPGWCPSIHAVGPFRPVLLVRPGSLTAEDLRIEARLTEDGHGELAVSLKLAGTVPALAISCGGETAALRQTTDGRFEARLTLENVNPWWPHTHGTPHLHEVVLEAGDERLSLGRTGFRRIEIDREEDGKGFALRINGQRIFCRGAVWTNADLLRLPGDAASYRPLLELARDANMNMLRVGGTMVYETSEFFRLCDELGILVWHDFQFANFDYPAGDPDFVAAVEREAEGFLRATQGSPSFAVACGGSEIEQQAAMMGVSREKWQGPLTQEILPAACARLRPDIAYVANSPTGGAMPFSPNEGVTHYFGVSAYRMPLEDARRAEVKFAAECLAFANLPEAATVERHFLPGAGHSPEWKALIPRDRNTGWDFEDVRDHYVEALYGVKPLDLRYGDPERYLDFGRAAVVEAMETVFAEWRRAGSRTAGGLVWNFRDLFPSAGWGVVDATGAPKSAWFALKRAFRPVMLALSDEGTNGLYAQLVNDTADKLSLRLEVSCLNAGAVPVASGALDLEIPARCARAIAATEVLGAFFDATYAFRFGPPAHDVTHARLIDAASGVIVAEAFHFPRGRGAAMHAARLDVRCEKDADGNAVVVLSADRLAQSVHIRADGFLPGDNWFHLAPGNEKRVTLRRLPGTDHGVSGEVGHLGSRERFSYSAG